MIMIDLLKVSSAIKRSHIEEAILVTGGSQVGFLMFKSAPAPFLTNGAGKSPTEASPSSYCRDADDVKSRAGGRTCRRSAPVS